MGTLARPRRNERCLRPLACGYAVADMNTRQRALWFVAALLIVVTLFGFLLLGPLGAVIVIPTLAVIWLAVSAGAGGPAAGA